MTAALIELTPWLAAMVVLICCSAFFSASEAAMFYLRWQDRQALAAGTPTQQLAARLLDDPDRLLSAVLFWNLVINLAYFAIVSITAMQLEARLATGGTAAAVFTTIAVLAIIFFSEMVPKTLAVLSAPRMASCFALPLAACVRVVDPLIPALRFATLLSQRLIWPRFQPEPYLDISDLERAIELGTEDAQLVEQEQVTLRNIVLLSEIRADEWMRPRAQFSTFAPPVTLAGLRGRLTPGEYLLISEPDSEEVAAAIRLRELVDVPDDHLEHYAEPVIYVPWCTTAADVLEQMETRGRKVAAVVNEFGETIGILTVEDILDSVFTYSPSRAGRLPDRHSVRRVREGAWHVSGMTSLRRLGRYFQMQLPEAKSVTVGGVVQDALQRLAVAGDECSWGPFHVRVLQAPQRGQLLVELTLRSRKEPSR